MGPILVEMAEKYMGFKWGGEAPYLQVKNCPTPSYFKLLQKSR